MKNVMSVNIIGKCPPPLGGVTIHTLRLYQWLSKEETVSVKFTTVNQNALNDPNIKNINNYGFWILRKLLYGFKEDIVHYQGANYYGLIMLYAIHLIHGDFKLVLSIHGEGYIRRLSVRPILNKFIFYILRRIDVICSGVHLEQQLINHYIYNRISVIDPFLPPLTSDKNVYPTNIIEFFNTDTYLICANAFNVDKIDDNSDLYGLHILSKLAKKLDENHQHYKMIILISDINDSDYVNKLFCNVGNVFICSNNSLNGWQVIDDCDLLIRPTSTDGSALSIKEALYFKTNVIASNVTPRDDRVVLFNYPDVNDLYEKTVGLMRDKPIINIKERHGIKLYIENYKKLLKLGRT